MKYLLIHIVFFLGISVFFSSNKLIASEILPLAKPKVDLETKITVEKKKIIYPEKKPSQKKDTGVSDENVEAVVEILTNEDKEIFIFPAKKPIIFKAKVDKSVQKSSVVSKKDFKIAKAAFKAIDKNKWTSALKISKKSNNPILYDLVNWMYLKKQTNSASFYDYASFIAINSNYKDASLNNER